MLITRGYGDEIVNFVEEIVGKLEEEDNFVARMKDEDTLLSELEDE